MVEMYNRHNWKEVLDLVLPPRKRADFQQAARAAAVGKRAAAGEETGGGDATGDSPQCGEGYVSGEEEEEAGGCGAAAGKGSPVDVQEGEVSRDKVLLNAGGVMHGNEDLVVDTHLGTAGPSDPHLTSGGRQSDACVTVSGGSHLGGSATGHQISSDNIEAQKHAGKRKEPG